MTDLNRKILAACEHIKVLGEAFDNPFLPIIESILEANEELEKELEIIAKYDPCADYMAKEALTKNHELMKRLGGE